MAARFDQHAMADYHPTGENVTNQQMAPIARRRNGDRRCLAISANFNLERRLFMAALASSRPSAEEYSMAAAGVAELDDTTFDGEVLKSAVPVLVDFWAPWCGPCRMIAPAIDQLATESKDAYRVVKVNIDNASGTAGKFGIMAIPTVMIFKGGQVVFRHTGVLSKAQLSKELSAQVG